MTDLAALPRPDIIESLDYEAVLAALVADFDARAPGYDALVLESEPVRILFEVAAYRELLLRARINDAARANLLAFALGGDLEQLAAFYGVSRLVDETDEALRERTVLAIQGRSTAATASWYRFRARSADARVKDVAAYREEFDPTVHIAVLATDGGGTPDAALLAAVEAALDNERVRAVNDTLVIEAATLDPVTVAANIWLQPETPQSVFDGLSAALLVAWEARQALGLDLTRSWITSVLQASGVHKVEVTAPVADVVAPFNRSVQIDSVVLTLMGRDY